MLGNGARKRILLIDDHHDTCEMFVLMLSQYECQVATTALEGLDLAQRKLFDLYLLDNWLPELSGIEMCRQIRTFDPNTPIVFVSAAALESDRVEAVESGAQAYLIKPVDPGFLLRTVSTEIDAAYLRSVDARLAEIAAIQDHIKEWAPSGIPSLVAKSEEATSHTRAALARARNGLLRTKAYQAFTAEGGTRANFRRMWAPTLEECLES